MAMFIGARFIPAHARRIQIAGAVLFGLGAVVILLRLALRCDVIALVDGARPVRLCRCHGCSLLSPDSAMSASDVQARANAPPE